MKETSRMKRLTSWASQHRSGLLLLLFLAVAAPFSSTITQIVAGNGLTGGGNGGSVTVSLSAPVSIANGGTNRTTALNNNRAMVSSGGAIAESNAGTSSQVLVGGSPPAFGAVPIAAIPTGTTSSTVTIGNDTRLPPAPSGAGKMLRDTGSGYGAITAGTTSQVLVGGSTPSFGNVPSVALTSVPAASLTGAATQPTTTLPNTIAVGYRWSKPVTSAATGLITPLAANSASNTFTGASNPDVYRNVLLGLPAGWDGGTVTCTGTDASGTVVSISNSTPSSNAQSSDPWLTVTGCTKTVQGASAATAALGPGPGLGIPIGHRSVQAYGIVTVNNVLDSVSSSFQIANHDPWFAITTAPNGSRTYILIGFLN